ncbi:AP endonuclease [Streptosporangium pseudovulgare]|uniref:Xylose isomerase-like TIM barrel domain-containing protein n=1 Tax=Streptosporangium pseudovulgare TaxID=35765 RepID=A0ABQ2R3Y7_9ACTN|nr:AP endonuclease [Streptosporangium pseudovulgare]GGQ09044.1 hypothetical protein GCM10010140_44000 [Streptosporangium pseudovulgare]
MTVGLYSISVRGFDVPGLLAWAASHRIPFVHLRGGPRGVDLAAQPAATVKRWAAAARSTVPVTGVTADVDVADLAASDAARRARACRDLAGLAEAADLLGAGWVRLLACTPLTAEALSAVGRLPVVAGSRLPLLVEPHHRQWMTLNGVQALARLVADCPAACLLADTTQLAAAPPTSAKGAVEAILDRARVLHLSDPGTGWDTPAHADVAAAAAARARAGAFAEVAVEWTGADRSPHGCLARYHAAVAWWQQHTGSSA